jgi:predicted PurR-regulated permease PerM
MARVLPRPPRSQARSLFVVGTALLVLYLFGLRGLSGVPNALLLGFAGVVFAVVIDLPAERLARRMPRSLAVIVVLVALALAIAVAVRFAVPALARQFAVLAAQVPVGADRLWAALRRSQVGSRALPERLDLTRLGSSAFGQVVPFVSGAFAALGGIGIVVTIGAFVCADPEADLRTLDAVVPERHRALVHEIIHRSAALLRRWMAGSLVSMAIVGGLTAIGLLIVRVHGWLALGCLAFVGTLVPYLGSLVVGVAIAAAGLADSPKRALVGLGVYAIVQLLLGNVIQPLISRKTMSTPPTLLLIFQFIMGSSFGVLGVLLAQPLLAVATVVLETLNEGRAGSAPAP